VETHSDIPDFERLMELLQIPAAYPHPVRSLQWVQTHCSCVFLTGDYAYKVKKPVDFGFLDYHTLEQRRFWCEQELRLNRRLCPDVYLDVLPITLEDGRLTVGGSGTPIEWAVRMHQLREEDMLPQRLRNGSVGSLEMGRLAGRLECQAPDAVIRQRLLHRHSDPNASDADLLVYEQQRYDYAKAGPLLPPGPECRRHLIADTTQPVADTAHHIAERFRAQSPI
jgi:hypothetical protein